MMHDPYIFRDFIIYWYVIKVSIFIEEEYQNCSRDGIKNTLFLYKKPVYKQLGLDLQLLGLIHVNISNFANKTAGGSYILK